MSWSISMSNVPRDEINTKLFEVQPQGNEDALGERNDQVEAARAAAYQIIFSDVLGDGPYNVSMYGHANPEHQPRPNWSNDTININISQASRPS